MQEQWVKWEPFSTPPQRYILKSIFDSPEGRLTLILIEMSDTSNGITIVFPKDVIAYQYLFRVLVDHHEFLEHSNLGLEDFWTFFKVKNSNFSKLVLNDASETINATLYTHFVFKTRHDFIDVLALREPHFKPFNKLTE